MAVGYITPWEKATLSTTVGAASLENPAAAARRFALQGFFIGIETATGDCAVRPTLIRTTAASTGTAVVPSPLDPADAAANVLGKSNITVNGAAAAVAALLQRPFNMRGGINFEAKPGREIIVAATISIGIELLTTVLAGATPPGSGEFYHTEQ
jgi:hypothetical protein